MSRNTATAMLSCRDLIDFLDDYVEERLARAERARFDAHLVVCDACRRYLKSYSGTLRALALVARANEDEAIPEDVPRELVAAILAARSADR